MRRILSALLLCPLSLCLLAGCAPGRGISADSGTIESLRPVLALGIDAADGALLLSAAGSGADGSPFCLRAAGVGIVPALEALQLLFPQGQLSFSHVQYLVVGRRCAEGGIDAVLDYVERDIGTRMGTALFVLRDGMAADLVGSPDCDAAAVLETVRGETARRGNSHLFSVRDVAVALAERGAATVCALRRVRGADGAQTVAPDGYGILKSGRLIGFLDGAAAQAAGMLLGVSDAFSRTVSDGSGGTVTLALSNASAAFSVSRAAADAPPAVEIRLRAEAAVAAADSDGDAAALEAICRTLAGALREDALHALALSRAEHADYLALGRVLRMHGTDPAALPPDWPETLEVRVSAEVLPVHGFDLAHPVGTEGGARA